MSAVVISGNCQRIIFQNPDNGYTVFTVKDENNTTHTCTGCSPNIRVGQLLRISGQQVQSKYGLQLESEVIETILPKDRKGILRYLSSGVIPGIGEGFAKRLVAFAGEKLFEVLDNNPDSLYAIEGIGKKRLDLLLKNWKDHRNSHEILMFLAKFQVGPARALKIYQTYGEETLSILQNNPYQIYQDIRGIGFKIADDIALSMGIEKQAKIRLNAGLQFVLEQGMLSGHCYLPQDEAAKRLAKLLKIDLDIALSTLINDNFTYYEDRVYLTNIFHAENKIKKRLALIHQAPSIWRHHSHEYYHDKLNHVPNITLSPTQKSAILNAINSKIAIITGGPGVGKTTITKAIIYLAKQNKLKTLLCAPTGRAAKKLGSATESTASTIHRLLKIDPVTQKFQHHEKNLLAADLIIIDESSMIDVFLANHLLNAINPLSNIIFIGDTDQLPSVGPGAILRDLIEIFPNQTAKLTEIFRQARDSKIIQNAHLVNAGKMLIPNDTTQLSDFYFIAESNPEAVIEKIDTLLTTRIPKRFGFNPSTDIQILSPMHKGLLGTLSLNTHLQSMLNQNTPINRLPFRVGDKVIQTKNNYDKDVFNGDVGFIESIDTHHNEVIVDYGDIMAHYLFSELDEIQLAYAISIHKSQGSEYPCVIIPMHMQHFTLLERNLLYTAITRGKQLVVLIGEMKAVAMAIRNQNALKRFTSLSA